MTNHPNRNNLTPKQESWLAQIKTSTRLHGSMVSETYMAGDSADIRAVDRLISLGLVERVTPPGGGAIRVRTVVRGADVMRAVQASIGHTHIGR
jgi:hypothetical protein